MPRGRSTSTGWGWSTVSSCPTPSSAAVDGWCSRARRRFGRGVRAAGTGTSAACSTHIVSPEGPDPGWRLTWLDVGARGAGRGAAAGTGVGRCSAACMRSWFPVSAPRLDRGVIRRVRTDGTLDPSWPSEVVRHRGLPAHAARGCGGCLRQRDPTSIPARTRLLGCLGDLAPVYPTDRCRQVADVGCRTLRAGEYGLPTAPARRSGAHGVRGGRRCVRGVDGAAALRSVLRFVRRGAGDAFHGRGPGSRTWAMLPTWRRRSGACGSRRRDS
jgi:hypothetical protein